MGKAGVHNIANDEEWNDIQANADTNKLIVVDCYADWCGPCKAIAPKVVEFSDTYPDVTFYKMDIESLLVSAEKLAIRAMPTFLLFKGSEKVATVVGANPVALESAIKQHK